MINKEKVISCQRVKLIFYFLSCVALPAEQTIAYLDYDSKKNVYNLAAFGFSFEELPHR